MVNSKSFYVSQFREAWEAELVRAKKLPLSPKACSRLRRHAEMDIQGTIDALMEDTGAVKSNGRRRTWPDDEPVWAAWARWYPAWTREEADRVIPEIVRVCALDRGAERAEANRNAMAGQSRVAIAERVVATLDNRTRTQDELAKALYPEPKAHKARRALKRVTAMLDGLGVIGSQKCRDGLTRWALWRGLWAEDRDALLAG